MGFRIAMACIFTFPNKLWKFSAAIIYAGNGQPALI